MKKYIVGFLAGLFFAVSATAFADDVKSLIGLKVQGESTVTVDGQTLKTIIVDGKTYASVRSIGEAAGYTVSVEGKKVSLKAGDTKLSSSAVKEKYRLEKIDSLEKAIQEQEKKIEDTTALLNAKRQEASGATTDKDKAAYASVISQLETALQDQQRTLEESKANLADLNK